MTRKTSLHLGAASTLALAIALGAGAASAQVATSTIRGSITEAGAAEPGAAVVARDTATGFTSRTTANAQGGYALSGLRPGSYEITATTTDGQTASDTVVIGVGQVGRLDLALDAAVTGPTTTPGEQVTEVEEVVVVGRRLVETRTSEVATNVTPLQINTLPQSNRNFLNFATLAPGVRGSTDELRQVISAGANGADPEPLTSSQVNVFIDGVSLKSNVQQGGLVGQDSSRGNPFSQLAVQEFRVSTSNFKAEYEQAGTSIISAVTKSGTNDFQGEVFGYYQDDSMIERDFFERRDDREVAEQERKQYGVSLGGPIIRDRLLFFGAYEVNDQVRSNVVTAGGDPARQAQVPFDLGAFEGSFPSPFKEELFFGKLTWRVNDDQTLELSGSYRDESDIRSFGGATSFEAAENIQNEVLTVRAQHTFEGDAFLNEFSVDYLTSKFEPTAANPDLIGQDYFGVIRIGGRDTTQAVEESRLTFRNNLTLLGLEWNGEHVVKAGVKVSLQDYDIQGANCGNPVFRYDIRADLNYDFSFPFEACYSPAVPRVQAENTQIGLFIQDDWQFGDHLTFNLGLRWDYETNANNNDFVTPPEAVTALRALEATLSTQPGNYFDADDYISTGDNREPFKNAFQPRIGVSYDVFADSRTVFFAGYGRFYDRTLFRNAAEESLFRQVSVRTFQFSRDGADRNGQPTIVWDPSYLSREGLDGLIAARTDLNGELRVFKNDQKQPYTDQFSFGVRQRLGDWNTSLTFTHQIGKNEIGYFPANRATVPQPNGDNIFIPVVGGFANIVASTDVRETRFTGVYVTADKPYNSQDGWGATFAYTYADAEQKGFLFNFDRPNVEQAPFVPNGADETHRVVATGILDLPWGLQGSTIVTYGSGAPFFVTDLRPGFQSRARLGNFGEAQEFFQADLRLTKTFEVFGDHRLQLIGEVFNVTNKNNFGGYDGFIPPEGPGPNFGQPSSRGGPPRSYQVGLRYSF